MKTYNIVVVGAGFAGISFAKKFINKNVEVLLIDQNNYHNFQPLMYQVATGGLQPDSIAYPIRRVFRKSENITFRMAEVQSIVPENKCLKTSIGLIYYDYLVIATGSQNNFFNFDPVKNQLFALKSIPEALNIRSYIFQNLEKALIEQTEQEIDEILNIAIIGGGPAGIEMAGALAEMKSYVLPKDFPELDLNKMNISLYEASPKLLSAMSTAASAKSLKYLKQLGVNVMLNAKVKEYNGSSLILEDKSEFKTDTVIWTAGVKGAPINGINPESVLKDNRIAVDHYNKVLNMNAIYAIGDVSACITPEHPRGLPMLATVAQQQGKALAKNILREQKQLAMKPFIFKNKGTMATVGRKRAVVDLPYLKFQGFLAWLLWMFVHLMSLVGFKNKVLALVDWAGNYFTYDKPLGLIIRPYKKMNKTVTMAQPTSDISDKSSASS